MEYKLYKFTVFMVLFIFFMPYTLLGCNLKLKILDAAFTC